MGIADALGEKVKVDFCIFFAPTVNDTKEAKFAPHICSELIGAQKVEWNPPLIMGSEGFSFMLEKAPGCCVDIGNNKGEGGCEIYSPAYDFNDAALPLGAAFFARLVERRLGKGAA